MKKYWPLFVLPLLLLVSSGLYADVTLTDDQAKELDQTLTQLETVLKEQEKTISDLESQSQTLKEQLNESQKIQEEQDKEIKTLRSSYKKHGIFSVLQNVLIAIASCAIGLLVGLMF